MLIENDIFIIPLYHGTSSLFLESILKNGLGGNDPLNKLGAREFFNDIYKLADKEFCNNNYWIKIRDKIQPIVMQQFIGDNFSFKHGESYLAVNRDLAIKYARENYYGSEYLTYMGKLYDFLDMNKVEGLKVIKNESLLKVLKGSYDPILITLNAVKVQDVETETGRPLQEQVEEIEMFLSKGIIAPLSFKLNRPIYRNKFTVTKLNRL